MVHNSNMRIDKVINNNVVSALDEDGTEVVVMGRGIGYHMKQGMEVSKEKIEKVFRLESPGTAGRFGSLLEKIPLEHLQISTEIIDYARNVLNRKLNESIYLTLTDHINFSIERFHMKMMFCNPLIREVKSFYKEEYLVGEYAIALVEKKLGIRLPSDEAASIALHIVNAEYNIKMRDTIDITNLIQEVLGIIEGYFQMKLEEHSISYERLITHVRFLAERIYCKELLDEGSPEFCQMIAKLYPEEYQCSRKVREHIAKQYEHSVTDEEVSYLAVHIKRVRM
jgi:beta-glucoside operon transcriptional antiterminator